MSISSAMMDGQLGSQEEVDSLKAPFYQSSHYQKQPTPLNFCYMPLVMQISPLDFGMGFTSKLRESSLHTYCKGFTSSTNDWLRGLTLIWSAHIVRTKLGYCYNGKIKGFFFSKSLHELYCGCHILYFTLTLYFNIQLNQVSKLFMFFFIIPI